MRTIPTIWTRRHLERSAIARSVGVNTSVSTGTAASDGPRNPNGGYDTAEDARFELATPVWTQSGFQPEWHANARPSMIVSIRAITDNNTTLRQYGDRIAILMWGYRSMVLFLDTRTWRPAEHRQIPPVSEFHELYNQ